MVCGVNTAQLLTHSPVDEHLGCFQRVDMTNKGTVNIHVQALVWTRAFISSA